MFRPRLITVLLLHGGGLVKTVQFRDPVYVGEPMNAVKIFNDLEADEIIMLDIDAGREGRCISTELIRKIGDESYIPFAAGGGIRTVEEIGAIIQNGAEKVVLGRAAIDQPELISTSANIFGSQSIIVCLDVQRHADNSAEVYTDNGTRLTGLEPVAFARQMAAAGAGELIVQSITSDGCRTGYDINLIRAVSEAVDIPVIALGGAGCEDDFAEVIRRGGASAAAAGSFFVFVGRKHAVLINYPDKEELTDIFLNVYQDQTRQ